MDKRISELDELLIAKNEDFIPIVDTIDPTLVTKRITSQNLRDTLIVPLEISEVNNLQSILDNKLNLQSIIDGGSF